MSNEVDNYLSALLTRIEPYQLTPSECQILGRSKSEFITRKILRKKYRRRANAERRIKIAAKVAHCVEQDIEIGFTIPFGGYKHFWNASHPEPDWAELFHFRHMAQYLLPILAVHAPGVVLEYVSEDLIVPRMDNYPDEAMDAYAEAFSRIINWYGQFIPTNLRMRFWRLSDRYDKQAIIHRVEQSLPERTADFLRLPADKQTHELRRSVRSVFWTGKHNMGSFDEQQKRARVIEARLMEKAFSDIAFGPEFAGTYYDDDNRICTCFSYGMSSDNDVRCFLTLQSSHGSIVDHWIGRGVIQRYGERLQATILSPIQWQGQINDTSVELVRKPVVPLRNCRSIDLIDQ